MAIRQTDIRYTDTVDPTSAEDSSAGFTNGDEWENTTTGDLFELVDEATGEWINKTEVLTGSYTVISGPIEITNDAILVAPSIAVTQNDYNPNDGSKDFNTAGAVNVSILILNATSNVVITGLVAPSPAKTMRVLIFNDSATSNITLNNNDAGSSAVNRFLSNGNVTINEKEAVEVFYSVTESRWIPVTR